MTIFDDHTDKILDGLRQPEWEKLYQTETSNLTFGQWVEAFEGIVDAFPALLARLRAAEALLTECREIIEHEFGHVNGSDTGDLIDAIDAWQKARGEG